MYGLPRHEPIWTRLVQDLAATQQQHSGNTSLLEMRRYPLVVSTQIASMGALARSNYGALRAFVADPQTRDLREKFPAVLDSGPRQVVGNIQWIASALVIAEDKGVEVDDALIGGLLNGTIGKRHTPLSDHLYRLLMPLFQDHVRDDNEYAELFELAEVYIDLMAADAAAAIPALHGSW